MRVYTVDETTYIQLNVGEIVPVVCGCGCIYQTDEPLAARSACPQCKQVNHHDRLPALEVEVEPGETPLKAAMNQRFDTPSGKSDHSPAYRCGFCMDLGCIEVGGCPQCGKRM